MHGLLKNVDATDRASSVNTLDGVKYLLADDSWLLIRPSGTEPVLRVYAQADSLAETRKMLDATKETIL